MAERLAEHDVGNRHHRYPVLGGQRPPGFDASERVNASDVVVRQRRLPALLGDHIGHIVGLRSQEEVLWVDAANLSVVAGVTDTVRTGVPVVEQEAGSVCAIFTPVSIEPAMPSAPVIARTCPQPAAPQTRSDFGAVPVDLAPKAGYRLLVHRDSLQSPVGRGLGRGNVASPSPFYRISARPYISATERPVPPVPPTPNYPEIPVGSRLCFEVVACD
jgi:hypothetical protein